MFEQLILAEKEVAFEGPPEDYNVGLPPSLESKVAAFEAIVSWCLDVVADPGPEHVVAPLGTLEKAWVDHVEEGGPQKRLA